MDFQAFVKSIKANVVKEELTISFMVPLDEESLAAAEKLSMFAKPDSPAVDVVVTPLQGTMDVILNKKAGE
jgi:hypothetical protein